MIKPNDVPRHTDQRENTGSQKLDTIEESLKGIMNAISSGTTTQNTRQVGTSIGDTITVGDIETSTEGHSGKTWTDVVRKGRRKEGKPLPLDQTNLVVSGVKLGTLGLQLAKLLANNDVDLKDWDLLTTRSDATFLTFKITVRKADADRVKDPSIWPEGYQIRPYNPPKRNQRKIIDKNKDDVRDSNNTGGTSRNWREATNGNTSIVNGNNTHYIGTNNGMQKVG